MVLNFFKKRPSDEKDNSSSSEARSESNGTNNGENRHRANRESDQRPYSNRQTGSYNSNRNEGTNTAQELSTARGRIDPSRPNPRPRTGEDRNSERRPVARPYSRENGSNDRRPNPRPRTGEDRNSERRPVARPYSRENSSSDRRPNPRPYNREGGDSERRPAARPYSRENSSSDRRPNPRPYNREGGSSERRPAARPYNREGGESRPYQNRQLSPRPYGQRATAGNRPNTRQNFKSNNSNKPKTPFIPKPGPEITEPMRLNKYIANTGLCSRRESDEYIKAGHITVNDVVITEMGMRVKPGDVVKYRGSEIQPESKTYIIMNKPKDFVTTVDDPNAKKTVIDLVQGKIHQRVYPVGRLDRNTTGVLLLTNDGELTKQLTHPKYNKKKIYHVHLDKEITPEDLLKIKEGFDLEDGFINADDISYVDESNKMEVGIEIHSGKNRIIRRIFHHLDYKVIRLDRVYFAGLTKLGLSRSKWRFLTNQEISALKANAYQ